MAKNYFYKHKARKILNIAIWYYISLSTVLQQYHKEFQYEYFNLKQCPHFVIQLCQLNMKTRKADIVSITSKKKCFNDTESCYIEKSMVCGTDTFTNII